MAADFEFPIRVRYMEVDAQNVVFNGWYLTWFDEALAAFLEHRGLPYPAMLEAGIDVMLVHSEIDWRTGVRWRDDVVVGVELDRLGTTSFTLAFEVRRRAAGATSHNDVTCTGSTVYVVVGTDGSGKRPIPPVLADALGPVTVS